MADGATTTIAEQINQTQTEQAAKEIVEAAAAGSQLIADKIRLANLGRRYATVKVMSQATYSLGLAEQYQDQLREGGFTDEMRASMAARREVLSTAMATQQLARTDAHAATRDEGAAFKDGKKHLKKVDKLLPVVLRKHKITGISPNDLKPDGTVGRSTKKLLQHLEKSRKVLAKLEEQFKPHFGGRSPLEVHDEIIRRLSTTDLSQESQRRDLPSHSFELLVAKGEMVEVIDDMNRVGQVVFDEDELVRAQFNSNILKSSGSKRGKGDGTEGPEAEEKLDARGEPNDLDDEEPAELAVHK